MFKVALNIPRKKRMTKIEDICLTKLININQFPNAHDTFYDDLKSESCNRFAMLS